MAEQGRSRDRVISDQLPASQDSLWGLDAVEVEVTVVLGDTEITIEQAAALGPDDLVPIGGNLTDPVDVLVNGRLIARGKLVVVEDSYGVQITELVGSQKSP